MSISWFKLSYSNYLTKTLFNYGIWKKRTWPRQKRPLRPELSHVSWRCTLMRKFIQIAMHVRHKHDRAKKRPLRVLVQLYLGYEIEKRIYQI